MNSLLKYILTERVWIRKGFEEGGITDSISDHIKAT